MCISIPSVCSRMSVSATSKFVMEHSLRKILWYNIIFCSSYPLSQILYIISRVGKKKNFSCSLQCPNFFLIHWSLESNIMNTGTHPVSAQALTTYEKCKKGEQQRCLALRTTNGSMLRVRVKKKCVAWSTKWHQRVMYTTHVKQGGLIASNSNCKVFHSA